MKKLIVILLIALLPAFAFADFQLGGVAMYKGLLSDFQGTNPSIGLEDFTFGGEARLKLGILQGGVSALYYPADTGDYLTVMTDVGLSLDLLKLIRLGAGIGPNFSVPLSGGITAVPFGFNVKVSGEVLIGKFSIGLVGYYYLASLKDLELGLFKTAEPWLGLTLMYQLF